MTDKTEIQIAAQHEKMVERTVRYLSNQFSKCMRDRGRAIAPAPGNFPKGNKVYELQVEFSYMIDEIQRGPRHFTPRVISDCNEFLDAIMVENAELKKQKR